jgi:Mitochondrial ribosomal protein (VAR1)
MKKDKNNNKISYIFDRKIKNNYKIIPLNKDKNTHLNFFRYFPPANKEWINSIYVFNKNDTKFLPTADKLLLKLIKSYFNLYNSIKTKPIRLRFRRLSIKKIFVSKAEIKHTNYKVVITIYVYNREKIFLENKLKRIKVLKGLRKRINIVKEKFSDLLNQVIMEKKLIMKKFKWNKYNFQLYLYMNQLYKDLIIKSLKKEILTIYLKHLLYLNKSKFQDTYLNELSNIINKIYNKKVEFNIINLKYIHLNSDILTQSISLKLKRRKNTVLKVLKKFFNMINLPNLNKLAESSFFKDDINKNLLKNINTFNVKNDMKDSLNQSLFNIFSEEKTNSIENLVINTIKYKKISGLRLEATGRLSRRITASRSVFKFKYKGSLKNIDSSYKRMPSVLLRGYLKSNIQYSKINSKTRNGSFGIKGWISSK